MVKDKRTGSGRTLRIWFDLENAPHVLILAPVIRHLKELGHQVYVTARDYGQVSELMALYGVEGRIIGRHAGKSKLRKVLFLMARTVRLLFYSVRMRFNLAVCHGSRGVFLPCKLLGIPVVLLTDYEHTAFPGLLQGWARLMLVPQVMSDEALLARGYHIDRCRKYPGLKEDLYVHDCAADPGIRATLGIPEEKVMVLIRPPATMAHYHVKAGEKLFYSVLDHLAGIAGVHVVLVPRTADQRLEVQKYVSDRGIRNLTIPARAFRGPELILSADVVIGGGGTMNREAACLGVPVYSMFAGTLGCVDRHLIESGKMGLVESLEDLAAIHLMKRKPNGRQKGGIASDRLVGYIVDQILSVVSSDDAGLKPSRGACSCR